MHVKDVMTSRPEYLNADATIREAAMRMKEDNRGFTPVAGRDNLVGIVTDRDIAIRAMAEGKSPDDKISSILTGQVFSCYQDDDINKVLQAMQDQEVQRLIVFNNETNKEFVGVVSLSDIADHCKDDDLGRRIVNACRHYH